MRRPSEIKAGIELSDYGDAREKYRPSKIDVLWVAESPPVGGGYFYFETTSSHNHLFRETMKALYWWPETETMHAGTNKIPYLKKFHNHGYFLIDSSEKPLNDIKKDRQREPVISQNLPALLRELEQLSPAKILLIKKSVFNVLHTELTSRGYNVLNRELIPFPSSGGQPRYRNAIRRYLQLDSPNPLLSVV